MKKKKLRSSHEELKRVTAKVKAIQDGELDDATKDKICQEIVENFLTKANRETQLAAKAVRDAEQALEAAKAVFDDKLIIFEVIGGFLATTDYRNNL